MRILRLIVRVGHYGSAAILVGLMILMVANAIGRSFFRFPVHGAIEIGSYMLLMIVALGIGGAAVEGRHIKVDLVMTHLPKKAQVVIDTVMLSLTFIMLAVMTWATGRQALMPTRYSSALEIPDTPFKWVFTVGWGICAIGSLAWAIENFRKRGKDGS